MVSAGDRWIKNANWFEKISFASSRCNLLRANIRLGNYVDIKRRYFSFKSRNLDQHQTSVLRIPNKQICFITCLIMSWYNRQALLSLICSSGHLAFTLSRYKATGSNRNRSSNRVKRYRAAANGWAKAEAVSELADYLMPTFTCWWWSVDAKHGLKYRMACFAYKLKFKF